LISDGIAEARLRVSPPTCRRFSVGGGSGRVTVRVEPEPVTYEIPYVGKQEVDGEADITIVDGETMIVSGDDEVSGSFNEIRMPIVEAPAEACP
jgi:hypothetical protein